MKILCIIPARYGSTRFPGKPLFVINGKTMIQRVYEQALKCDQLWKVIVATDHETIFNHLLSVNGNVVMTSGHHKSGTERCCEVVESLEEQGSLVDVVINIQGDEPYIDPRQIDQLIQCFDKEGTEIATLVKKISSAAELSDPNVVKAVIGEQGQVLYFSRSAIPFLRGKEQSEWFHHASYFEHIGIYGYRTSVLKSIVKLKCSPLESAESLEQLRWLENGHKIQSRETEYESVAIDTPADLSKITNRI